jgi:predicted patatin/cPLA2 family phospholipase
LDLHGVNAAAAIAAIQARAARFRAGDRSPDGRKLALVVEGGALRGVCSAGGVVALEDLRLTDVFDHVYGTSAGVMNASYFVAGQARLGIRIYYEDMNRRSIVNPWRFWKILDLERLFQRAVMGNKRLDVEAVLASRSRLFIATLELGAAAGRLFDARALGTPQKVLGALKAATAAPLLVHGRLSVEGLRCMDAGIVNAFPVEDAIAHGCTDVLVMLTRPVGYRRRAADRLSRWLFNRLCAAGNPKLARAFAVRH